MAGAPEQDNRIDLLAAVELNRRIIEAMPGGIVHVGKDGAILTANPEALRILGLSYDEITKKYAQDWDSETLWEDGSPCPASEYPVTKALVTGKPQPPTTIGIRRRDGETSWAVFTAIPVSSPSSDEVSGVVVTFLDITERRKAEAALRKSEGLLRSVLESAPNPIATTDREGILLLQNKGPDVKATLGKHAWDRVSPSDQEAVKACFERVLGTGEPASYEIAGQSGSRWLVYAGPRYEDGRIVGVTFVAWDVTEQRALEARVAIADRMASIGTLAAGVAHEINNPLTYLLANLDWLAKDDRADAPTRERVLAALEGAQRIRSVVSDIGPFSHVSNEGRRTVIDVRQLMESALRMAQGEIRYRARVTKRYDETPLVLANDARLGQVFLNLVVNAAQAIPEGNIASNEITIATGTTPDGSAFVEISDTGVGIPPEMLPRIFEPFVTTKPRGIGTGLGLYISRNIVSAIGGELSVETKVGKGTTFRAVLPAAGDAPAVLKRNAVEEPPASVPRRLRILVVDDEPTIAVVLKRFLQDHEVSVAQSGREAIDLLATSDFDLAFCDVVMPDLTGIDVYEHVREHRPGLEERIVFMTGGAFTERTRKFIETIPNEVLDKPFTVGDIAAVLMRRYSAVEPAR